METLKIKFKLHALEFEVEGGKEIAASEFKNFHENILTPLLSKVNIIASTQATSPTGIVPLLDTGGTVVDLSESNSTKDIPHINDIENTIECTESEWIAIYAFYESEHGTKNFMGDAVRKKYLQKRETDNRSKNYNREWKKLFASTISTVKDNEYKFKSSGIEAIRKLIIGGTTNLSQKTKKPSTSIKNQPKKTSAKSVEVAEFDIFKTGDKISLEELFEQKGPSNTNDRVLSIAYYITKINKQEAFNEGNIDYAYKALGLKDRPNYLRQTINNIKNSKVWFKDHSTGGWTLERLGEIYFDKMTKNAE